MVNVFSSFHPIERGVSSKLKNVCLFTLRLQGKSKDYFSVFFIWPEIFSVHFCYLPFLFELFFFCVYDWRLACCVRLRDVEAWPKPWVYIYGTLYLSTLKNKTKEIPLSFHITLRLPWVTKTEFLLTLSIQYQAGKWWE